MKCSFRIEQLALCPRNPRMAKQLLTEMGAGPWAEDHVKAEGEVFGNKAANEANLSFDYDLLKQANEFEVLEYTEGENWLDQHTESVASHIGMHCTEAELTYWKSFFAARYIPIAQEVNTYEHTNPVIKDTRRYHYCIFATRDLLGVDTKFIVRRNP